MTKSPSRPWPKINPAWRRTLIIANVVAAAGFIWLLASAPNCTDSCSDYGFIFLLDPWLLVPLAVVALVPVVDLFVAYYLVGSRLGFGSAKAKRLTAVILAGLVLIIVIAKLLYVG